MAGFRMHVSTSTVLGCGYAGVLNLGYGVPLETAIVSGAMCGFAGMLPDLDSDYGVPLRETMAFAAATIPMMLVARFQSLGLGHDAMALAAVGMYLFVRFGVTKLIRKYTVHRGMFHSFPAMLIFAGLAFLITGASPIEVRCYKAGGVLGGFLSHLVLDEIYAVEWKGGRWRFKKSFGTAMKFWGNDAWSNFSTYAKLAIVAMLILGEPSVMQQLESRNPQFAGQINDLRNRIGSIDSNSISQKGSDTAGAVVDFFNRAATSAESNFADRKGPQYATPPQPIYAGPPNNPPSQWQWPTANQQPANINQGQPSDNGNSYGTAQRPNGPFAQ
jgi:hypothetical protein